MQPQPDAQQMYAPPPTTPPVKQKNTLGLVALIVAIVGFIFACIPGALIVGWILLPIAFILSIVSLFMKGKGKALGITGLILSVVGTIVAGIVFLTVVGSAFDEAFSGGDVTVTSPETEDGEESEEGSADEGSSESGELSTRENPFPIGTTVEQGDWTFTLNRVDLDATQAILDENEFNDAPDDGMLYILANMTLTYVGTDSEGSTPWATVEYVTVDGNTIPSYESMMVVPDELDAFETLYEGASTTGNQGFAVPEASAGDGVLAVTIDMFGDKVFFAVN